MSFGIVVGARKSPDSADSVIDDCSSFLLSMSAGCHRLYHVV